MSDLIPAGPVRPKTLTFTEAQFDRIVRTERERGRREAIAAFAEAMRRPEVVEAAAIEIHAEGWNGDEEWGDVHPVRQDNYKKQAEGAATAMLQAIGVETEGE